MANRISIKQLMQEMNLSRTTLNKMIEEGMPHVQEKREKWFELDQALNWFNEVRREITELQIGKELTNDQLSSIFGCGTQGGMRRSHKTNTLIIISDPFKSLYEDKWDEDILYYTGMGKIGPQDINSDQNKTLNESNTNGVDIFLFEVFSPKKYRFMGQVELVAVPFQEYQPDENGDLRTVWMFPVKIKGDTNTTPKKDLLAKEEKKEKEAEGLSYDELLKRARYAGKKPSKRNTSATAYERNAYVTEFAKRRANGVCELCEQKAPFKDKKEKPYLETHHIVWLSRGGDDTIENTVALCPNCHRKMHALDLEEDKRKLLAVASASTATV
ncbi:HNH endonuclease [Bacillus sp. OTU530]|uniref:HNH endonuclease n=1 Tax=Bacillus sp. OTU530 TaxID=3043862 RepID=UPI00313D833F